MNRNKLGKLILSFVVVVGAIVSTAVDWNTTHLFNPAWPPHALSMMHCSCCSSTA